MALKIFSKFCLFSKLIVLCMFYDTQPAGLQSRMLFNLIGGKSIA